MFGSDYSCTNCRTFPITAFPKANQYSMLGRWNVIWVGREGLLAVGN